MRGSEKLVTAAEAAGRVHDRDTLAVPLGPGLPSAFLHALGERERFDDLVVFAALLGDFFALFTKPGVHLRSGFFGPVERMLAGSGFDVQFLPASFRRFAAIAIAMRPRVMATAATPPDDDGWMSLSLHAGATVDELHRAGADPERVLVVEVNRGLPRTLGLPPEHRHAIHVDEADLIVESEASVLEIPDLDATELERAIAAHVLPLIPDGATLQTGIGGIPSEIVEVLAAGSGGDYGVHSEMFTDGLMKLHRAGKVTNRKGCHDGFSAVTFAAGTRALYDWLDGNDQVRFLPVELVNAPDVIARNRAMVAINGALAVDLHGQVAADTLPGRQFSGVGGHQDFTSGAFQAPGGRSFICLPSTATVNGQVRSRIVPLLEPGMLVTTPRHEVDAVVTEHGVAELAGRSVAERMAALIAIAHPDFRPALEEATRSS